MELETLLQRCGTLEERAAALYRGWAAGARDNPPLCNLWTGLAREEEEHARSLRVALRSPAPPSRDCLDVAGWITPRVGGVGPMTRAMLLKNAVDLAEQRAGA